MTCNYNPNGIRPQDAQYSLAVKTAKAIICQAKIDNLEANNVTVNDKLTTANVVDQSNVKYYGAVGDGVTDDTQAFTDALQSGACKIFIPSGTYLITDTLTVPPNVSVFGECPAVKLVFNNSTANYKCFVSQGNNFFKAFTVNYIGSNLTTSTMFSVVGGGSIFENVLAELDVFAAFFFSYDGTSGGSIVYTCFLGGLVNVIRYTAAYTSVYVNSCVLFVGPAGTAVDTTNAGTSIHFFNNEFVALGGPSVGINAVNPVFSAGNFYFVTTPITGPALGSSTIMDAISTDYAVNTTGRVSINGLPVLNARQTGWSTGTTGANIATDVNATTITATDPNIQDLAEVVNGMKAAMLYHGLISS